MKFYEVSECGWAGESYFYTNKAAAEKHIQHEYQEYGVEPTMVEHSVKASRSEIVLLINLGIEAAGGHPNILQLHDEPNFGQS